MGGGCSPFPAGCQLSRWQVNGEFWTLALAAEQTVSIKEPSRVRQPGTASSNLSVWGDRVQKGSPSSPYSGQTALDSMGDGYKQKQTPVLAELFCYRKHHRPLPFSGTL